MTEVINRKYKKGVLVEETKSEIYWQPNAADLDIVRVGCKCGNEFDMPWDAIAFGGIGGAGCCGQCGESGSMKVIVDPSPNKCS